MPWNESTGTYEVVDDPIILATILQAIRDQFSEGTTVADIGEASPLAMLAEASAVLPLSDVYSDIQFLYSQLYLNGVRGLNLDYFAEGFGFTRKPATRSIGTVEINFKSIITGTNPFVGSAQLAFKDSSSNRYDLTDDIDYPAVAFDSNQTGTASEAIGATTTRIAQKFSLTQRAYVQGFKVRTTTVSGTPTYTVSIQTSAVGSPSGTVAHANLVKAGATPTSGVLTGFVFTEGAYLEADTDYWLVAERTAGEATFDGGAGGTADQVKVYSGSWALSALVENLNVEVWTGGVAQVTSRDLGSAYNIAADSLAVVPDFPDGSITTTWNTNVDSFSNLSAFTSGQDVETDALFKRRIRAATSSKESARLSGIIAAVSGVSGVTSVTGLENVEMTGGQESVVFDSTQTGTTMTEPLDATNTSVAQKVVVTEERWVQHFSSRLAVDTSLVADVRLETDSAGSPSGTLAFAGATLDGFDFPGGTTGDSAGTFAQGAYLPAGTYWLRFDRVSGSGQFDGGTGGTADQVKYYDGAWNLSANTENLNASLIGGIPPKSFRIIADGGDADAIAQSILDSRAAGIKSDGVESGVATDDDDFTHTENFDRPTLVPVYVEVEVQTLDDFTGDADTIRDLIIAYIGGTDTGNNIVSGLDVRETLVYNEIIQAILDDDNVTGIFDVTDLSIGTAPAPSGTANLVPAADEKFTIADPASITVTLVPV